MKLIIKEKQIQESDLLKGKELGDAATDLNFKIQKIVTDLHDQDIPLQVAVEYIKNDSMAKRLADVAENGMVTLLDIFKLTDVMSNINKEYARSTKHMRK